MSGPVTDFKRLASWASYYFADDTCKKWGWADEMVRAALKVFDANLELQPLMREAAKEQLWQLTTYRPEVEQ